MRGARREYQVLSLLEDQVVSSGLKPLHRVHPHPPLITTLSTTSLHHHQATWAPSVYTKLSGEAVVFSIKVIHAMSRRGLPSTAALIML